MNKQVLMMKDYNTEKAFVTGLMVGICMFIIYNIFEIAFMIGVLAFIFSVISNYLVDIIAYSINLNKSSKKQKV